MSERFISAGGLRIPEAVPLRVGDRKLKTKVALLDNGLKVLMYERPEAISAAFVFGIHYGHIQNILDQPEKPVAHAMEHWFYTGTTTKSTFDIWRSLTDKALGHDGVTEEEAIKYSLVVHPSVAIEELELICDMIANPLFDNDQIEREKEVINEEYLAKKGRAGFRVTQLMMPALFAGHPASISGYFTPEQVKGITRDDLVNAYNTYYRPDNCVLVAYGAFNEREVLETAVRMLGGLEGSHKRVELPRASLEQRGVTIEDTHPALQGMTMLTIALKRPPLNQDTNLIERSALNRAIDLLNSRLFEEARLERRLVYSISAGSLSLGSYAYSSIDTQFAQSKEEEVKRFIFSVVKEISDGEISADRLRSKIDATIRSDEASYERVPEAAISLTNNTVINNMPYLFETGIDGTKAVTLDGVRAAAAKYLNPERAVTILLRPERG